MNLPSTSQAIPTAMNPNMQKQLNSSSTPPSTPPSTLSSVAQVHAPHATPTSTRVLRPVTQMILNRLNAANLPSRNQATPNNDSAGKAVTNGPQKMTTLNNFDPFEPMANLAFSLSGRRRSISNPAELAPPAKVSRFPLNLWAT